MDDQTAAQSAGVGSAGDPLAAVLAALRAAGRDPTTLCPAELAPLDQFHLRGTAATRDLARLAAPHPGTKVLDVGGGLGGPARLLAREFGCAVTVVDLSPAHGRLGRRLTAWAGLAGRVAFVAGDARALPVRDAAFDLVWTQSSGMTVADKERVYGEAYRVLRPGGRLALQELTTGRLVPLRFPVPWAADQAASYLRPPVALRSAVATAGLAELAWVDLTAATLAWYRATRGAGEAAPSPLGIDLLLGPDTGAMVGNLLCNLVEGRLGVVQGLFARPRRA